jgi:hypothetical protein
MEILKELPDRHFEVRKLEIPKEGNIYLHGITQSGKSSLVLDSLQDDFLYIDFENEKEFKELPKILRKEGVPKTLVLETYNFSLLYLLPLLPDSRIIIISWRNREIAGFQKIVLYPLLFEELVAFKPNSENLEHYLLRYSQMGGFPIFAKLSSPLIFKHLKRVFYFALSEQEIAMLKDVANNIGVSRSKMNIFQSLKQEMKISKDKFYLIFDNLIRDGYIVSVPEFNKSVNSRFYLIDSALKNSFSRKSEFHRLFENMVISELSKKGYNGRYYRSIDFYIKDRAFVSLPFFDEENIEKYLNRSLKNLKKIKIKNVIVITMDFETELQYEDIVIEVIKFTRWALSE